MENEKSSSENKDGKQNDFKKPILIGKIGRLPRKVSEQSRVTSEEKNDNESKITVKESLNSNNVENDQKIIPPKQENVAVPYKEPSWSGLPETSGQDYYFEVLKDGVIIETVNLMKKPFWVFGRLNSCDIFMQHPTISRHHAVIQYRNKASDKEEPGFYIYDLSSTHGTFLNKNKLKSRVYARIQVGHMLKLGCSTRTFILNGPSTDTEDESEFTITELKEQRAAELRRREEEEKEAALKAEMEEELRRKKEEERGVDWGLGEDAEEETDLSENPFAQTNNEDLYLDDPKKALRGFFEREGIDLEYDCNEQGMGQFLCKVELPIDDELGRPIVAEVLHKGKKKEAVVQCALEACRILDRYGVLRQAQHESRKRKAKNWEENDYYDSDDDTFLDRTGAIEKKREMRMKAKLPPKAETYESLLDKEKKISLSITELEKQLTQAQKNINGQNKTGVEEDSLDSFMKELKQSKPDKETVNKLKTELSKLKVEHANIIRLANIAKPASLPPLVSQHNVIPSTSKVNSKALPIFGKRIKLKVQLPAKPTSEQIANMDVDDEEEEECNTSFETKEDKTMEVSDTPSLPQENLQREEENENIESSSSSDESDNNTVCDSLRSFPNTMTFKKFEKILKKGLPPFADKHQEKLETILSTLKRIATVEDRMHVDWKILTARKRKVMKLISDLRTCEPNGKLEYKVSSELSRILSELNAMTEQKYKDIDIVKKMGNEIKSISEALDKQKMELEMLMEDERMHVAESMEVAESKEVIKTPYTNSEEKTDIINLNEIPSTSKESDSILENKTESDDKKKKKNQRRIQQRQEKAEIEKQRGYEEDATREDYSMWVPPQNQTGDGKTSLNEKYGY